MKKIVKVSQVLVGVLFIFSGFVKADDPAGFTIKLHEYFAADALNMPWLDKFAFSMAFSIPIIEMTLGFMLLLGTWKKLTLTLIVLMMVFFTFLTWYTAHYNKVLECGCFGDAIPMTSWQSFYKNVVLMVFILILIIGNKHIYSIGGKAQNILVLLFLAGSTGFAYYCYNYLPVIDFRPYKVGTDIKKAMQGTPDENKFYYTLKNKKSGETKEFDKFPDNYQNDWTFVGSRTEILKKGIDAKIKDFNISALAGNDVTDSILAVPGYQFLLILESISEANKGEETVKKINALADDCLKNHIGFICLTASDENDIAAYQKQYHSNYKFFTTDGTVLKTMIRSNPGLMLIKGGVVEAMWHYHSIPTYSDVASKYLH
ncbi:MAG TPA: BT_3928 family protein [Bacteroidia bacterium]|jgi:uncharacterized membrane protein YphA (DoxX/SURF4 family)|nr:BT_3928 family protein [Bacteroidia bacterium]